MSSVENSEKVIFETELIIENVKNNWRDPVGKQYVCWLEQTLEKLKQLERRREIIRLKAEKIALLCENIASTDADSPKILKKTR